MVKTDSTSSLDSTLNSLSTALAKAFRKKITGASQRASRSSGGPSRSAAFSGPASARFFGTISPITMCRKTTTASEIP